MTNKIPNRFVISSEEIIGEWDWNRRERCIVCNLPIAQEEKLARCPDCGHSAHLEHLLEWIKIKGVCPYCKRTISAEKIIVI
jgi:hypothetical protein